MLINEIVLSHAYYRQERVNDFVNYFKRTDFFWGIRFYFKNKAFITPGEMAEVFNYYQNDIEEYIRNIMIDNHYEPAFRTLCKLRESGINWLWVNEILTSDKPKFIKMMLTLIKEGKYDNLKEVINDAVASDLNWPEITIIQRSLKTITANDAIAEAANELPDKMTSKQRLMFKEMLLNTINRGNIFICLYNIDDWGITVEKLPELAEILNQYKNELVVKMLKDLKHGKKGLMAANQTLSRLESTGINWPELDVIRQSLNHEVNANK